MNIYFSLKSQERTDETGRILQSTEKIILSYGKEEWFHLNIRDLDEGRSDNIFCWDAVVYNVDDLSMLCHTLDEEIVSKNFSNGQLEFPVFTRTENFRAAVQEHDAHGWLDVRGFDSGGKMVYCMRFRILAQYSSDPSADLPAEVVDDFATMSWVKKFLSNGTSDSFVTEEMLDEKLSGMAISSLEDPAIPFAHNGITKHTLSADEVITFDTSALSAEKSATMELWLTMPETVVSFSMPDIVWIEEPAFDAGNTLYAVVLRWDGAKLIGNIAYTLEVN